MAKDHRTKLLISGAIAGALTPILLKVIMYVLNLFSGILPTFSLKLATPEIAVNIRQSLTGLDGSLAGWAMGALGISVNVGSIAPYIYGAIGGALLFIGADYVANALGLLKGDALQKTRVMIFVGNIAAGAIFGAVLPAQLGYGFVNLLLAFAVNAAVLAWIYTEADKKFKIGLIPY